jgi:hypothetical protein
LRVRGLVCCAFILIAGLSANSQAPSGPPQQTQPGQKPGMSSGIAAGVQAAPQYDEQKRPITAGGFVDKGTIVFEDATKASGLSTWQHVMGKKEKK